MPRSLSKVNVYLEIGQKRTFAGAIDWPGWCRSGRDEESALQALLDYGPRYARAIRTTRLGFRAPKDESAFVVFARLKGNATTDFGAPSLGPSNDVKSVSAEELQRFLKVLRACWRAFDADVKKASDKTLRSGPRGGGRQLESVIQHVLESNGGYMNAAGWKFQQDKAADLGQQIEQNRKATLDALASSARGEIPTKGPRGGVRWTPRYFVRRVAWHILDHAWEIEDRILEE
jgi:hypothetical protein